MSNILPLVRDYSLNEQYLIGYPLKISEWYPEEECRWYSRLKCYEKEYQGFQKYHREILEKMDQRKIEYIIYKGDKAYNSQRVNETYDPNTDMNYKNLIDREIDNNDILPEEILDAIKHQQSIVAKMEDTEKQSFLYSGEINNYSKISDRLFIGPTSGPQNLFRDISEQIKKIKYFNMTEWKKISDSYFYSWEVEYKGETIKAENFTSEIEYASAENIFLFTLENGLSRLEAIVDYENTTQNILRNRFKHIPLNDSDELSNHDPLTLEEMVNLIENVKFAFDNYTNDEDSIILVNCSAGQSRSHIFTTMFLFLLFNREKNMFRSGFPECKIEDEDNNLTIFKKIEIFLSKKRMVLSYSTRWITFLSYMYRNE